MDKLSTAAALSGWSQNRNVSRTERDRSAGHAFRIYESVADGLRELLTYAETKGQDCQNEPGWSGYADMAMKLRAILDDE